MCHRESCVATRGISGVIDQSRSLLRKQNQRIKGLMAEYDRTTNPIRRRSIMVELTELDAVNTSNRAAIKALADSQV